jgi:hypothetical protein
LSFRWFAGLLAVSCLAQTPAPFSHRLHLKLGLQCVGCHASAASSTQATDNNLPKEQACVQCHASVTIPPPPKTLVVHFSHQQHLQMGNIAKLLARAIDSKNYLSSPGNIRKYLDSANACAACHRGMEESDAVTPAAMPQMADCLVCHAKIENPFSCETCHAPGPHLKPASHTADYLERHSRPTETLDKPSCAVCHGRRFTCLGCHS